MGTARALGHSSLPVHLRVREAPRGEEEAARSPVCGWGRGFRPLPPLTATVLQDLVLTDVISAPEGNQIR